MKLIVIIIFGATIIPLVTMAIFLLNGKGASLIAGYNTMSKTEKAKYDEKAICRSTGRILLAVSVLMLLFPAGIYLEIAGLLYFGIASILLVAIGAAVYANTGNRFRINGSADAEDKKKSVSIIIVVSVISVIICAALGILFYQGGKDPGIHILDVKLEIKSMYGLNVSLSDITNLTLIEKSMSDIGPGKRVNGYGGIGQGQALKGNFKSSTIGEALLFVQSKSPPTLKIERSNGKDIYISFKDGEKTRQLYSDMQNK